ncbi:hypothetical protein CPB83DRAFT_900824 [Crepidotus variabilis]|uniref:Uncharacterized protein n=1 Tax=Crepidotus variabilis TaxID=179855 RepID=A0A9P6BDZ9_9AGAR|nr:hypothetical protein CPB83DRAFT_900829 [Crepidotus variabilis]KAF9521356.1 hypothetical protein CPB83DRAFT_900824 [Crepidotus variabilis]
MNDPDDIIGRNAIVASLEKRWAATNQEMFLAAVILNPFYRHEPFSAIVEFNNASIGALIGRVYMQIFRSKTAPDEVLISLRDYLNGTGPFEGTLQAELAMETRNAHNERRDLDPDKIFNAYSFGNHDMPLFQLARRVLSITSNSASLELKARTRDEHQDQRKRDELRKRFLAQGTQYHFDNQPQLSETPLIITPESNTPAPVPTLRTSDLIQSSSIPHAMDAPSNNPPRNTFRDLIHQHMNQAAIASIDQEDDEFPEGPISHEPRGSFLKMPLAQIFDFEKSYWKNLIEEKVNRTFNEELELFQMLDLDGDGNDLGADVDEATADILSR